MFTMMGIVSVLCLGVVGFGSATFALADSLKRARNELKAVREEAQEFKQYVLDWADLHHASVDDLKAETTFFTMPRPRESHHQKSKPDTDEPTLDLRQILPFGEYDLDTPH